MMREDQLLKFRFFNYTGAFSVNKKSREMIQSLRYASAVLDDNRNMLLMYPQGKIHSIYETDFTFEQGVERILRDKQNKIHVLFTANLVDYLAHPKPTVSMYISSYAGEFSKTALENSYNDFYNSCITAQKKQITL